MNYNHFKELSTSKSGLVIGYLKLGCGATRSKKKLRSENASESLMLAGAETAPLITTGGEEALVSEDIWLKLTANYPSNNKV